MSYPTDRLTPEEAARVHDLATKIGTAAATEALGLRDLRTLARAMTGETVSRLAASAIRANLARRP